MSPDRTPPPTATREPRDAEVGARRMSPDALGLSSTNEVTFLEFLEGLPANGKELANQIYEGLSDIPGVIGKLAIAYNKFWIDRHERKAVQLNTKLDGLGLKVAALEESKQALTSAIEELKVDNLPGVASLRLQVKAIDQQINAVLTEQDRIQSKLEARQDKAKAYTNDRDAIADKLIGRYQEELVPMERELERLQTSRSQMDLLMAATEIKHSRELERLDGIESRKIQVEEALRRSGMSDKAVKNHGGLVELARLLAEGRGKVRAEQEKLAKGRREINQNIARVDAQANPYRDKVEEFGRVKASRPVVIEMPTRRSAPSFQGTEDMAGRPRTESRAPETVVGDDEEDTADTDIETTPEVNNGRLELSFLVKAWNTHLYQAHDWGVKHVNNIKEKDFIKSTSIPSSFPLGFEEFRTLLVRYYKVKFKQIPADQLQNLQRDFDGFVTACKAEMAGTPASGTGTV